MRIFIILLILSLIPALSLADDCASKFANLRSIAGKAVRATGKASLVVARGAAKPFVFVWRKGRRSQLKFVAEKRKSGRIRYIWGGKRHNPDKMSKLHFISPLDLPVELISGARVRLGYKPLKKRFSIFTSLPLGIYIEYKISETESFKAGWDQTKRGFRRAFHHIYRKKYIADWARILKWDEAKQKSYLRKHDIHLYEWLKKRRKFARLKDYKKLGIINNKKESLRLDTLLRKVIADYRREVIPNPAKDRLPFELYAEDALAKLIAEDSIFSKKSNIQKALLKFAFLPAFQVGGRSDLYWYRELLKQDPSTNSVANLRAEILSGKAFVEGDLSESDILASSILMHIASVSRPDVAEQKVKKAYALGIPESKLAYFNRPDLPDLKDIRLKLQGTEVDFRDEVDIFQFLMKSEDLKGLRKVWLKGEVGSYQVMSESYAWLKGLEAMRTERERIQKEILSEAKEKSEDGETKAVPGKKVRQANGYSFASYCKLIGLPNFSDPISIYFKVLSERIKKMDKEKHDPIYHSCAYHLGKALWSYNIRLTEEVPKEKLSVATLAKIRDTQLENIFTTKCLRNPELMMQKLSSEMKTTPQELNCKEVK